VLWGAVIATIAPFLIVLIIVLILAAAFVFVIHDASQNTITNSVQSYFSSGDYTISSEDASGIFKETGSLVLVTDKDIQNMSKETLYKLKAQSEILYNSISNEGYVGNHKISDISYANGFNITNAYEFMLNAERLNFNRIVWKEITREETPQVKDIILKTDEETNLKYPDNDEDDKELKDFAEMVVPYLQSYIIPTSMLSGLASEDIGNVLGNFAYQIMDKAYHQIQINQYTVQNVTKHKAIIQYIEEWVELKAYRKTVKTEVDCEDPEAEGPCYDTEVYYGYSKDELDENLAAYKEKYKQLLSQDAEFLEKPSVLDVSSFPQEIVDKDIVYGIVEAETLKSYYSVQYEQKLYNQEDVDNFTNPNIAYVVDAQEYTNAYDILSASEYDLIAIEDLSGWSGVGTITEKIQIGEDCTYKYFWQDTLEEKDTIQRNYTTNDVTSYLNNGSIERTEFNEIKLIENAEENADETTEEKTEYRLISKDTQYYNSLESSNELNKIDIINAVPDVYNDYLQEGTNFSKNIGFSRSHLQQAYQLMERYLSELTSIIDYGKSKHQGINIDGVIGLNFIWPLDPEVYATISSCAGYRNLKISTGDHKAVDIAAGQGTEIYAAQSGVVVQSGRCYGYFLLPRCL